MIDNALNMKAELRQKKFLDRQLVVQRRRMAYMKLDPEARYHIWQALFKSRVWYSIVLTTRLNKKFKDWTLSFLYRAIKQITGLKGNPSMDKTFASTFMLDDKE